MGGTHWIMGGTHWIAAIFDGESFCAAFFRD
jgi:hypothetical protein